MGLPQCMSFLTWRNCVYWLAQGVSTAYDRLRPRKKIFVHVYGWHSPYIPSPTPSSPPGLHPSVTPSVQCIYPLKERHVMIVSCTK